MGEIVGEGQDDNAPNPARDEASRLRRRGQEMVLIKGGGASKIVDRNSISYFEVSKHVVTAHFDDGGSFSFSDSLTSVVERLSSCFIRVHHSYAVNIDKISSLTSREVRLTDGSSVPVSRAHLKPLRKAMMDKAAAYLGGKAR